MQLPKTTARQSSSSRPIRKSTAISNPMDMQLDLASEAGLYINSDDREEEASTSNTRYLEKLSSEDYGSDDDLGDSEALQATKLHTQLMDRLAEKDKELLDKWQQSERHDYESNGSVLDHDVVSKKMETLRMFARHLRKAGNNRASLLARLAEPLAENHWLLDPQYHQQFVDTVQGMCELINKLPQIETAAKHCSDVAAVIEKEEDSSRSNRTTHNPKDRQMARMEKLVHEVEQATQWIHSIDKGGRGRQNIPIPRLS